MTIQGLRPFIWFGWIGGTFYLHKPWGPPELKSWISLHTLWSVLVFATQSFFFYDFSLGPSKPFGNTSQDTISTILGSVMLASTGFAFVAYRLVYIKNARALIGILNNLCQFNFCKTPKKSRKIHFYVISVFGYFSAALILTTSILVGIVFEQQRDTMGSEGTYLKISGPLFAFTMTVAFLLAAINRSVTFALIATISLNLGIYFEDFCDELEKELMRSKSVEGGRDVQIDKSFIIYKEIGMMAWNKKPKLKNDELLVIKYYEFIKLAYDAGKVLSPITFIQITSAMVMGITGTFELLVGNLQGISVISTIITCLEQIVNIGLIFIGQNVKDVIKERKNRLAHILTLKAKGQAGLINRDKTTAVARLMTNFNWTLSACGIFEADRRLISGIVATAMSYIVILFQFQYSLAPPLTQVCP